ncbi:hypothetical protein ACFLS7_04150 [Bacteroidota bacterium]
MKNLLTVLICTGLALNLLHLPVNGQQTNSKTDELEKKFYQAMNMNEESLKNYSWESRTDVSTKDDKVLDILIEAFNYGSDGKLQKKVINDQQAKLPSSFLLRNLAEKMKAKLVTYMNDLDVFLGKYSPDDQKNGRLFFSKATIRPPDSDGQILVSAENVNINGDKMSWWIDKNTYSLTKRTISTTFEGGNIEFTATYKYIPGGINYMAYAELLIPAKNLIVKIHYFDYKKN